MHQPLTLDEATAIYRVELPNALACLREGAVVDGRGAFTAGGRIIKAFAERPWRLEAHQAAGFKVKTSQNILMLNETNFGSIAAQVCRKILSSHDSEVGRAVQDLMSNENAATTIVKWTFCLFCAHEFFHTEQKLDSDTYADSDDFINVVTAADYQADVIAIDYVFGCIAKSYPVTAHRSLLLILALIHISVMQVFSPSAKSMKLVRAAFDRLLVWHLQTARIAAVRACPDFAHPSLSSMPVIAFPQLEEALGETVSWRAISKLTASGRSGYKIVIAICGSDNILRIRRIHATLQARIPKLIQSVLREDFSSFRDEAEEFFKTHEELKHFNSVAPKYLKFSIEKCLSLAESIEESAVHGKLLEIEEGDVSQLFAMMDLHFTLGDFSGIIWADVRESINGLRNLSRTKRGKAARQNVSKDLRLEVRRIRVRLARTLDEILSVI